MSWNSSFARAALALALFAGAAVAAHRATLAARAHFPVEDDVYYLPRVGLLERVALGHRELMADLVFLRTVNAFGAELTGRKSYGWLDRHLDTVNALDPTFRAPYLFGTRATMYNGLPITNESVLRSNHFAEAGLRQFPDDWELAFTLGCNYINELQTSDPRQRAEWRRRGAAYIQAAANKGGGPPWLASLAATIMTEQGQTEAAIRYLEEAYLTTDDEKAREEIRRLLAAKRQSNLEQLGRARVAFSERWQATLPYAPSDLFVLVGEPPSPRLDRAYLAPSSDDAQVEPVATATAAAPPASSDGGSR